MTIWGILSAPCVSRCIYNTPVWNVHHLGLTADPAIVTSTLHAGNQRADRIAGATLRQVHKRMGMGYANH